MSTQTRARRPATPSRITRAGEVLDLVRRGQASTTGQIADELGLARSTITDRIDVLLDSGLVHQSEPDPAMSTGRGRPTAHLSFNPAAGTALAAQLGISGVRLAVTDLSGVIEVSEVVDISLDDGVEAVLGMVTDGFQRLLADRGIDTGSVHGIGIGIPAPVELRAHQPANSPRQWTPEAVRDQLLDWLDVPVFVDHDVNLLAFGEHCARADDPEVLLCLKVGTVIGCGVVVNGRVVRGTSQLAGEIGHTRVHDSDVPCNCGNVGCLNAIASGGALAAQLTATGIDAPDARAVAQLARSGQVDAGRAVREAGRQIGEALASTVNLLNPAVISLWGYLAEAEEQLLGGIGESIARLAQPGPAHALSIEPALMGQDAGIYGAAMTVIEHALQPASVDAHLLAARQL
ncbi:Sugar kinase of the NBD/HSP70 family, may contain an N-terminal HTH domain [Microlunatus soli]|uniref:Sugar kinase of the NBD/HSP70 family, may contain an N-terminal HTH domain n=1 Tax=Microlunatus soli TaxID=630515 RepID=A0A1H1YMD3_9ACTN|nr:Sugar kinase of the NBD/HSP70 family, may contain an N-terminal HTH domain [Microlunatus soli]